MDKNYIIEKPKNLAEIFAVFDKMSSSLQAEILSVLIGIVRKSERNLLAAIDAQIYRQALELTNEIDDDVVADLLIDILTVLTSLTINASELKLLLHYLHSDNRVWVGPANLTSLASIAIQLNLEKVRRETVEHLQESSVSARAR